MLLDISNYRKHDSTKFNTFSRYGYEALMKIQDAISRSFLPLKKRVKMFMERRGVEVTIARLGVKKYINADKFFSNLKKIFQSSRLIWLCVGEMGHRFMEQPDFLDGVVEAAKNNADIRIIFGPRVDPFTTSIFKLAKEYRQIRLFQLDTYPSTHFLYTVNLEDKVVLIEESPHPEKMRVYNSKGKPVEAVKSVFRAFYIIRKPNILRRLRMMEAKYRMFYSTEIDEPIKFPYRRGYRFWREIPLLLYNFFISYFVQPLLIIAYTL